MPDTLFSAALRLCGLSLREAADFLGSRIDTVKKWSSGVNPVPAGVMAELHALAARIDEAAEQTADLYDELRERHPDEPAIVELGIAVDDHEARGLGFPCVGAQMAMVARLWSLMPADVTVRLVPRGSTVTTAGAADEHDQRRP